MKISSQTTGNSAEIKVEVSENDFEPIVRSTYNKLRQNVTAKGFRPGKAPNGVVEKEVGPERVQSEVLEATAEKAYRQALEQEGIRPVNNPQVNVTKFVPYTEAELTFSVDVMPEVKLADYKKVSKQADPVKVDDKEVEQVLESLRQRLAERKEVERAAKEGDEVTIDFEGTRNGRAVPGAAAKDYAIVLGSKRFIPGFEEELAGLKPGGDKKFTITFPKNYGERSLAGTKVEFSVNLKKVTELKLPKLDDKFAKSAGPFESLAALKKDIKSHLESENEQIARRRLENEVMSEVVEKSEVELPATMVEKEIEQVKADFKRRLEEQGVSEEQYLLDSGKTVQDHEQEIKAEAERRVKTGLVMSEVSTAEGLEVTPDELEVRIQVLAGQYQDEKMQEQLKNPGARREIANQLLMEKTVAALMEHAIGGSEKKDKGASKKSG